MTASYMLTLFSTGTGWRDVLVTNADGMHAAIALAERQTGCRVSHGVGGKGDGFAADFSPGVTIDAATGEVVQVHARAAKPFVDFGPPDVLAAIAAVIKGKS